MAKIKTKYIRDGRSPKPKSEVVSRVMSANRSKGTSPELKLRKNLSLLGMSYYRLHSKNLPGRPDIFFPKHKMAIFVNGCFWHRCPKCAYKLPKTNRDFWRKKFSNNVQRDIGNLREIRKMGWKSFVVWECALRKGSREEALKIYKKSLA